MFSLRICRLALSLSALLCTSVSAQRTPLFTSPLPTGVRLDPAGEAVDLGSLPINLVLTPEKDRAVVVLSGWREQGVQVVDLKTRKVTQTLLQDGAFYGAAFSPDGHHLCVSGGNTDILFVYAWKDGAATLENKFELAKAKTTDGTGSSYPAGLAFSPNGFLPITILMASHSRRTVKCSSRLGAAARCRSSAFWQTEPSRISAGSRSVGIRRRWR
jgi:DNA-binding beta-propeller fold protein YncE